MSFRIDQLAVLNLATVGNSITAGSFVKSGGTSSQFLKADGSVDSSAYITGITSGMVTTALGYTPVPNTRNITINGVTQDLSVDRTWTISAGVSSVSGSGAGISVSPTTGAVVVSNTGVTSNVAGTGISVSGATGAVTITNTGVTSIVAGTAITISGATGAVTINNAGVTSLNGSTGALTGFATQAWVTSQGYITGNQTITLSGDVSGSGTTSISVTVNQIDGWSFVNTGSNSGTAADSINSNGISYVNTNISLFGQTDGALYSQAYSSSWQHQIYGDYRTGQIAIRGKDNGTWQSWRTVLDSTNYSSIISGSFVQNVLGDSGAYNLNTSGQQAFFRFSTGGWVNGPTTGNYSHVLSVNGATDNRTVQIYLGDVPGYLWWRPNQGGTWHGWERILTSYNYNGWAPTLTGTGASGTWGISISGNAATATNADTVDGFHASQSTVANNVVVRDANGYIFGNYINMTDDGNPGGGTSISSFITKQGDNYYRSVSPTNAMVSIRGVASGSWGINITGSSSSSTTASYLPTLYAGGVQSNPQVYFGQSIGLRVAMTGVPFAWCDTLWINGYSGGDVLSMTALHTARNGQPRMWLSTQSSNGTSYGTTYEFLTEWNYTNYTLPIGGGWYGVNMPGSRWGGYAVSGGEIVFGNGLPNAGQMGMLIDGAYVAGENNGFWSLPSNNDWNGRRGMYWDGSYLNFTANSPTSVFTTLRLANGFELQQGGSNYGQFNSWVHLPGFHGLYSGQNSAHIYPNNGTYGSWMMSGSRGGWQGIEFNSGSAGNVTMMVNTDSNTSGFHNNSYGWQIRWYNGTLYCGKNSYGGNDATVLDSSNYTSYAPTLTGGGASGTWSINITGSAGSASTATYATNTSKLYSTDAGYCYGCANPYYGYLTYDGSRWLFQVSPGTPAAVRVAYSDLSGQVSINYNNDSNSTYQLLWGSGNSVYGTSQVYVNPSSDIIYARGGYVSPGNPWGTADSAFFPNGITTAGSTNWVYGRTYIGNAPGNGSGVDISSVGSSYFLSGNTSGTWGYAGQFVDRNNAANNYIPWSFESEYGNHSWGIVARFHIQQSGADKPAIQFTATGSNERWSLGYCTGSDYNFRITQNQAYRTDNSGQDGWGTERFRINTDGTTHLGIQGQIVYFNGAESANLYGIRGRFTNEYMHLYNKVGVGHPGGWGQGEGSTPNQGLSTYGGANFAYGTGATSTFYGHLRVTGNNNLYLDSNYGQSIIGVYASTRYQGVFAMGDSYKLPIDGTGPGNLYGLAWSHPNAGGVAGNLNTHGLLVLENGTFLAAISGSIRARDDMRAPIFYDSDNTGYYLNPAGTSNLYAISNYTRQGAFNMGRENTVRRDITSDQNYWGGAWGWGTGYGTWADAWKTGFSSWDIWGSGTDHPQGSGYVHAQGIISGQHYCTSDGSSAYGWMMVGAHAATENRYWLRGKWGGTTSGWVEMITSGNIGSQNVNYATTAGTASFASNSGNTNSVSNATGGTYTWTGINYFRSNLGGYCGSLSNPPLQAYSDSNNSAFFSFHKGGYYAVNMGLDADSVLRIGGWSASANRWQLDMSGNMTVAGDVTAYSDARVKENIETVEDALDKVLNLRGVYYNRTDSEDKRRKVGVIAQEILEVIPEVVGQDNDGMYNVSYGNIVGVLIEAIKEQQKQIDELKARLD